MRLRQIEIFYHVYRCGSITAAADELNVSQPSVSKVLRHAEDQLGFFLFERNKGRLVATDAAHELYREVRDIYERISALRRTSVNIRNRRGSHLHVATLPSLSLSTVPAAISKLRQTGGLASFELSTLHSHELIAALVERRADLCIGFHHEEHDLIEQQVIGKAELLVIAPPGRFRDDMDELDYSALNGAEFVGMKNSGPAGTLLAEKLATHEVEPHEIVTTHAYHSALPIVSDGVGIAVVDRFTAASPLASNLRQYHLPDRPSLPLVASVRKTSRKRKLIDQVIRAVADFCAG